MAIIIYKKGTHILLKPCKLEVDMLYQITPEYFIDGYDIDILPNGIVDGMFGSYSSLFLKYTNNIDVEVDEYKLSFGKPIKK